MSTPDWPKRHIVYGSMNWAYVLELERRYALLHQAVLERSQAPARGINCFELLAKCPPLPKEKERE